MAAHFASSPFHACRTDRCGKGRLGARTARPSLGSGLNPTDVKPKNAAPHPWRRTHKPFHVSSPGCQAEHNGTYCTMNLQKIQHKAKFFLLWGKRPQQRAGRNCQPLPADNGRTARANCRNYFALSPLATCLAALPVARSIARLIAAIMLDGLALFLPDMSKAVPSPVSGGRCRTADSACYAL